MGLDGGEGQIDEPTLVGERLCGGPRAYLPAGSPKSDLPYFFERDSASDVTPKSGLLSEPGPAERLDRARRTRSGSSGRATRLQASRTSRAPRMPRAPDPTASGNPTEELASVDGAREVGSRQGHPDRWVHRRRRRQSSDLSLVRRGRRSESCFVERRQGRGTRGQPNLPDPPGRTDPYAHGVSARPSGRELSNVGEFYGDARAVAVRNPARQSHLS